MNFCFSIYFVCIKFGKHIFEMCATSRWNWHSGIECYFQNWRALHHGTKRPTCMNVHGRWMEKIRQKILFPFEWNLFNWNVIRILALYLYWTGRNDDNNWFVFYYQNFMYNISIIDQFFDLFAFGKANFVDIIFIFMWIFICWFSFNLEMAY